MSTVTALAPWWMTAPNPPCAAFCDGDHEPGEFTRGAALMCRAVLASGSGYRVEVQQIANGRANEAGVIDREPLSIYYAEEPGFERDGMTPVQANELGFGVASALARAAWCVENIEDRTDEVLQVLRRR